MLGPSWVELITRIPQAYHDELVAITSTGAEIMVQRIMRMEEEFIILRGRPAGSTEAARILLLPWDQLNHVAFQRPLPEKEIQRIFGRGEAVAEAAPPAEAAKSADSAATAPEQIASPESATVAEKEAPARAAPPAKAPVSKSILLARLRARMSNDIAKG